MRAVRYAILISLAGAGFASAPAQAQYYWGWSWGGLVHRPPVVDRPARYYLERPIPSGEIAEILRDEGYRVRTRPVLSGDAYFADVETPRGQRLQVVVHAYDGDILERRLLGRGAPERPTVRRPQNRDQAALPPKPAAPRDNGVAAPAPVERAPLPQPEGQAAAPPSPTIETPPPARDRQTVTPPRPASPPPAAARPEPPREAATPPATTRPDNPAPTLESTEPPRQQARSPRVILPNPADGGAANLPPVAPLETQPARPAPPTPPVAPAPLN